MNSSLSWQRNQLALQRHLQNDDLASFLQWSTIQATMFVGNAPYIFEEYDDLLGCDNWKKYTDAIIEPGIGNPMYFMAMPTGKYSWMRPLIQPLSTPEYKTSGNLIHQAYHLKQWLDRTGQRLDRMTSIVEFGAGYGAMALIIYRLGFKGKYHIIDLPELAFLQQYYLNKSLPGDWGNIYWLNTLPLSKLSCDLFIACHSLSEVDIPTRERLLSQVAAKEYLFASSYEFDGLDNQGWFTGLGGTPGYDWVQYPHPYYENAFYQVGTHHREPLAG